VGSIINIGSIASQMIAPNLSIYTQPKSAVDAITRVLAKELGPKKIRVNSINPRRNGNGRRSSRPAVIGVGGDIEKQLLAMTPLGSHRAALGHCADRSVPCLRRGKLADGRK